MVGMEGGGVWEWMSPRCYAWVLHRWSEGVSLLCKLQSKGFHHYKWASLHVWLNLWSYGCFQQSIVHLFEARGYLLEALSCIYASLVFPPCFSLNFLSFFLSFCWIWVSQRWCLIWASISAVMCIVVSIFEAITRAYHRERDWVELWAFLTWSSGFCKFFSHFHPSLSWVPCALEWWSLHWRVLCSSGKLVEDSRVESYPFGSLFW